MKGKADGLGRHYGWHQVSLPDLTEAPYVADAIVAVVRRLENFIEDYGQFGNIAANRENAPKMLGEATFASKIG